MSSQTPDINTRRRNRTPTSAGINSKKKKAGGNKARGPFNSCEFHAVIPSNLKEDEEYPFPGMFLKFTGFVEKKATGCMYNRRKDHSVNGVKPKDMMAFVQALADKHMIEWVFKLVDPASADGEKLLMYEATNGTSYDQRGFVIMCPRGELDEQTGERFLPQLPTPEMALKWFNETFKPAYMQYVYDPAKKDEPYLVLDEQDKWYKVHDTWSELITHSDIMTHLVTDSWIDQGEYRTVSEFLKDDKGHVYSIWPRGQLPALTK